LEAHGLKPELRDVVIPFNMYIGWFFTIAGIKEKSVWTIPVNCWHFIYALLFPSANDKDHPPAKVLGAQRAALWSVGWNLLLAARGCKRTSLSPTRAWCVL
jgi:hypothetical protein